MQVNKELDVPSGTLEWRANEVPKAISVARRPNNQPTEYTGADPLVANNAAPADLVPLRLKLRFNQRDDARTRHQQPPQRLQNLCERDERYINGRQIDELRECRQIASVGSFHHDHAGVLAETVVDLAVADIHGIYPRSAVLQQTISEPARRRANIGCDRAGNVDRKGLKSMLELLTATADVARTACEADVGGFRYQ
jgi:hypothetical protein